MIEKEIVQKQNYTKSRIVKQHDDTKADNIIQHQTIIAHVHNNMSASLLSSVSQ